MATTLVRDGLRVQQWDAEFFKEYIRNNKFAAYLGSDQDSLIHVKENLTKQAGDSITFQAIRRLAGTGVRGANTLRGNEESLNNRSQRVFVELVRNAVEVDVKVEQIKTEIDLLAAAKPMLRNWSMETFRDDIIAAMYSIDGVAFAAASAAQRNTWVTNNADRVLFGAALSNYSTTFATAAANVDNTADRLTPTAIALMKRIAKRASPRIHPITVKMRERSGDVMGGMQEWYVCFVNPLSFRDLKENAVMQQANREAWVRGENNPLFTDGDLLYDGVIVREIEDIGVQPLGASSINIAPAFFCGAQAVGVAYAQRPRSVSDDSQTDYGRLMNCGIEEIRGVQKMRFGTGAADTTNLRDNGMVTGWFAAVGDA